MLEKCAACQHFIVLDMMHLVFSYADFNDTSPALINAQVNFLHSEMAL